jgi:hypothetical protein
MLLGNLADKIRETRQTECENNNNNAERSAVEYTELPDKSINYQVKNISELTEADRAFFLGMNIDPADVDEIVATSHGLVVSTGRRRWIEARLGKKPVADAEIAQLKADYNSLLQKLRALEKNMASGDLTAHKALMDKIASIQQTILYSGYLVTSEETRSGFKNIGGNANG